MAGKGSHEVVYRGKIVLLLNAKDGQLIKDLSLKGVHCLRPVIEVPTLFIGLLVSLLLR